jgi:hypothetical protein
MHRMGQVPTNDPLVEMLEQFQKMAERNIQKEGSLMPILFISNGKEVKIFGIPEFGEPITKKGVIASIQMGIANKTIKEFALLSEAWIGHGEEVMEHYKTNDSLENFPGREEVVMLFYSSPQKEVLRTAEMCRDGDSVSLLDWGEFEKSNPSVAAAVGTLDNLWPRSMANMN